MSERYWQVGGKNPDPTLVFSEWPDSAGWLHCHASLGASRATRPRIRKNNSRISAQYATYVLNESSLHVGGSPEDDPNRIARLKDYRSLMPLAQEARKPMFLLRPADGAFGGHQQAIMDCYGDFNIVTREIMRRCGIMSNYHSRHRVTVSKIGGVERKSIRTCSECSSNVVL